MIRTLPIFIKSIDVVSLVESVLRTFYVWQSRADQRVQLGELDDRLLADIGLDRVAAAREVDKPFWRR